LIVLVAAAGVHLMEPAEQEVLVEAVKVEILMQTHR
jgi:hypothetical protein